MVLGWRDLIRRKLLSARGEFVSADAQRANPDVRTYEMLESTRSAPAFNLTAPGQAVLHPQRDGAQSPVSPRLASNDEYFGKITVEHNYRGPIINYSSQRSPVGGSQHPQWFPGASNQRVYAKDYA